MENIYSPPIGALFEPIAIAAQNGLAELREQARGAGAGFGVGMNLAGAQQRLREQAEQHLRIAAMEDLRRDHPQATTAPYRSAAPTSGASSSSPSTGACRGRPRRGPCARCG